MIRLLLLVAGSWLAQGAAVAGGKAKFAAASAARPMAAHLPNGTAPLPLSLFSGLNWKSSTPPAFLSHFRMPSASLSPALFAKPTGKSAKPTSESSEATEVDDAIAREIRSSGVLKPLSAAGKKYDEAKLISIFTNGLKFSLDPKSAGPPQRVAPGGRRLMGFFDDVWDAITGFVEDVGCGAFAVGALPGYLLAYSLFHAGNTGYTQLSTHQKFFQRAAFSNELLAKVNVKYGAWFAPGFGNAAAVTMGSEIYVRAAKSNLDTLPTWNMTVSPVFLSQTRLVMHELGHSKQYAARNWNVASFGWDYLFNFCVAGMSYEKNSMEKDAETYRDNSDGIMFGPAAAHFKKWRKDDLYWATGYSKTPTEYSNFKLGTKKIFSLDLTKASTKIAESQRKEGTTCVRVLWGTSLASRTQEEIVGKPWDCVNQKPTVAPTRKPTAKPTTPPTFLTINLPDVPIGIAPTRPPTTARPPTFKIPA